MFYVVRSVCIAVALPVVLTGQPKFEVLSVRPSESGSMTQSIGAAPGGQRYQAKSVTLRTLIQTAYRLRADQIVGGPNWIGEDRFDLDARAEKPSSEAELREMLKSALSERFALRFRSETKDLPAYILTVEKGGVKMTPHDPEAAGEAKVGFTTLQPLHLKVTGAAASMELFAFRMNYLLDRPMLDRTGLTGGFDFTLKYTMEAPESMKEGMLGHDGKPIDFTGPNLFQALREQLGLHLEAAKAPAPVISITNAEKPSAN
jgi:uncharacterized protein (TIGR03435 family)